MRWESLVRAAQAEGYKSGRCCPLSPCDVPGLALSRVLAGCVTLSRTLSLSACAMTPAHRGGHPAGDFDPANVAVMHDGGLFLLSPAQASCTPSSGCVTSTARSCPVRPSASSTTSSSFRWPAGWLTRCWRGSSWRPSANSTCPWAPSGEGWPWGREGC